MVIVNTCWLKCIPIEDFFSRKKVKMMMMKAQICSSYILDIWMNTLLPPHNIVLLKAVKL